MQGRGKFWIETQHEPHGNKEPVFIFRKETTAKQEVKRPTPHKSTKEHFWKLTDPAGPESYVLCPFFPWLKNKTSIEPSFQRFDLEPSLYRGYDLVMFWDGPIFQWRKMISVQDFILDFGRIIFDLGGETSHIFYFHPENMGKMNPNLTIIFFRWVETTTNQG